MQPNSVFMGSKEYGEWFCFKCNYFIFPEELEREKSLFKINPKFNKKTPLCPHCGRFLNYDEITGDSQSSLINSMF